MKAKRSTEPNLKSHRIENYSFSDLIQFAFKRKSFYRDYKLLYGKDKSEVQDRVNLVLYSLDHKELDREIRVCFSAAILSESRPTYTFNFYLSNLIELHYSNESFSRAKSRIKDHSLLHYDPQSISYEWVLYSSMLSSYQRYLLFEYLVLGYSIDSLAKRRYCTTRTIHNHIKEILNILG